MKEYEIIKLGAAWPYDPERCKNCIFFEESLPDEDGDKEVACDYDGTCFVTGEVIYPQMLGQRKVVFVND